MLKQLIQRLLDSRTTPEEAAHSAMPSDKYTRLVDNGTIGSEWTDQAFSGIAAYDGYLFFTGTSTSAVPIIGIATAGYASNLTFPWEGARLATTIPIAKGQTWTVQGSSMKDVIIYLSKTVSLGGGYNRLVWRTLSCLRALSNFSQRSFCKAKSLGLEINPSHHLQKLPSLLRTGLNTRLLRTAGFESEVNQLRRQRCMLQWLPFLQEMVQLYVMCPSERVRLSFATSAHTQDKQTASLFPLSVLANLQTGGALC